MNGPEHKRLNEHDANQREAFLKEQAKLHPSARSVPSCRLCGMPFFPIVVKTDRVCLACQVA